MVIKMTMYLYLYLLHYRQAVVLLNCNIFWHNMLNDFVDIVFIYISQVYVHIIFYKRKNVIFGLLFHHYR